MFVVAGGAFFEEVSQAAEMIAQYLSDLVEAKVVSICPY